MILTYLQFAKYYYFNAYIQTLKAKYSIFMVSVGLSVDTTETLCGALHVSCGRAKVHKDLPGILKEYTKAVLRANLTTEKDIIMFSLNYFQYKCEKNGPGPVTEQQ